MRKFIVFLFSTLISANCFALDFESADILFAKQIAEQSQELVAYKIERMEYENSILLDEKGNCYFIPGEGITQIVRINKDGMVDSVVSNIKNAKSECFRKIYLGSKYKKPPIYPVYEKMYMGYGSSEKIKNP